MAFAPNGLITEITYLYQSQQCAVEEKQMQ